MGANAIKKKYETAYQTYVKLLTLFLKNLLGLNFKGFPMLI